MANAQVPAMQAAINHHDLVTLGTLAEANALQMHAQNMVANPPFTYLTDVSWLIIETVKALRATGIPVYATMDAGPNVKLISQPADTEKIMVALRQVLPEIQVTVATPGPGIQIVQGDRI